jgi:hypothetical protein
MLPIDSFPAKQAFYPPALSGGTVVPTPTDVAVRLQAFPPAPLVNPFPVEPTPPSAPFLPASQGSPPVAVLSSVIPPAIDVNLMLVATPPSNPQDFVVTDLGSLAVNPATALKTYVIANVVDYETGSPPTSASVYLKITVAGDAPLTAIGVTLVGRTLFFTSGPLWIVPGTTPRRPITLFGDFVLIIPNADSDGHTFYVPSAGPAPGDQVAIDTARGSSEVVFQSTGQVQNIVPSTNPLLSPSGEVSTELPVQNALVSDQATSIGTPVDYLPYANS